MFIFHFSISSHLCDGKCMKLRKRIIIIIHKPKRCHTICAWDQRPKRQNLNTNELKLQWTQNCVISCAIFRVPSVHIHPAIIETMCKQCKHNKLRFSFGILCQQTKKLHSFLNWLLAHIPHSVKMWMICGSNIKQYVQCTNYMSLGRRSVNALRRIETQFASWSQSCHCIH